MGGKGGQISTDIHKRFLKMTEAATESWIQRFVSSSQVDCVPPPGCLHPCAPLRCLQFATALVYFPYLNHDITSCFGAVRGAVWLKGRMIQRYFHCSYSSKQHLKGFSADCFLCLLLIVGGSHSSLYHLFQISTNQVRESNVIRAKSHDRQNSEFPFNEQHGIICKRWNPTKSYTFKLNHFPKDDVTTETWCHHSAQVKPTKRETIQCNFRGTGKKTVTFC